jgi:hypothetical protein
LIESRLSTRKLSFPSARTSPFTMLASARCDPAPTGRRPCGPHSTGGPPAPGAACRASCPLLSGQQDDQQLWSEHVQYAHELPACNQAYRRYLVRLVNTVIRHGEDQCHLSP